MPDLNPGVDMTLPPILLTRAAGNLRLVTRMDVLSLWLLVTAGPLATDTPHVHPLAGDRPVATTDSDDPLTRWEVETVAENLAAIQHAQRQLGHSDAMSVITRLLTQARNASDDTQAVSVAVEEDEVEHLLETLNRTYVRMRTATTEEVAVGANQSPAVFLGMDEDMDEAELIAALGLPTNLSPQQQAEFAISLAIGQSVEMLAEQLYR